MEDRGARLLNEHCGNRPIECLKPSVLRAYFFILILLSYVFPPAIFYLLHQDRDV